MILNILKVFGLSAFTFFLAFFLTPILTHYLYKYKMWKKHSRSDVTNPITEEFRNLHRQKLTNEANEVNTPRVGGVLIWLSTLLICLLAWMAFKFFPTDLTRKLNFLSKNQTLLPLFVLIVSSLVGLIDDLIQIFGKRENKFFSDADGFPGLPRKTRIATVIIIGAIGAWWFFFKLGMTSIIVPFVGEITLGWMIMPFFIITMLAVYSGSIIDGIDGLAGGVMASIFSAYAGIAFFQNQINIAAFCAVIAGGILAFLWFNIPPARFYMGETGMLGLTTTITVVAFLTDAVAVLPIIAFPLLAASGSAIIQMLSKKFFHKKVFRVAPIHHHFEALGWPSYKVTMRFWVVSIVFAVIGMVIALIG
jgi:phospho-N-acetylmuramoyl-pentapeptide-transferase